MSRALLRHRRLLFPGARGGAAHPFVAAISASSCYTARFASTSATAAAAAGTQADPAAAASPAAAGEQPSQPPPPAARGRWGLLKFGALAAVAGAIGGVGYATYGAIPRPSSRSRILWRFYYCADSVWGLTWPGLLRV